MDFLLLLLFIIFTIFDHSENISFNGVSSVFEMCPMPNTHTNIEDIQYWEI